jgi:hypothetical protein
VEIDTRKAAEEALCSCGSMNMANGFTFSIEVCLPNGRHTKFLMERCSECGKMAAFPKDNAITFIREGYYPRVLEFYNDYLYRNIFQILWQKMGVIGYIVFFTCVAYVLFNLK